MLTASAFFWVFAGFYIAYLIVEIGLDVINLRNLQRHRHRIPELFKNTITHDDYEKSIAYTKSKTHFHVVQLLFQAAFVWILILSGAFFHIDQWLHQLIPHDFVRSILYPFVIGLIFYAINLPLALVYQFGIEGRFGFNKMTPQLYVSDQIKAALLSLILGLPLISLLFWLVNKLGPLWWIWGFAAFMLFQLLMAAIFPVVLAPIFYKFTPLPEGELKDKLLALAQRLNFKMAGIFTIDGSKRSTHSNAFFAGLGKTRRIVLFDTLVSKHGQDEIVSVIAHEMGHNIKKHIQRGLLLSSITTLVGFWVLAKCLIWQEFFETFGVPYPSIHVGFVLFALFASVFIFPLTPFFNYFSRKHEYEADAFSVQTTGDKHNMIASLVKLSKENLSNLTPHPWYSFFHYSHPTTTERAEAIEKIKLV